MRIVSFKKLAETVTKLREEKEYTKEELGNLTSINRMLIGRIEREDFVPSIVQLKELAKVLKFDIVEMFICKEGTNKIIFNFREFGGIEKVERGI